MYLKSLNRLLVVVFCVACSSLHATPRNDATLNADSEKFSPAKLFSCNRCNNKAGGTFAKDESNDELSPSQKFYLQKVVKKWVRKVRKRGLL